MNDEEIRSFSLHIMGLPENHTPTHLQGLIKQVLANVGIDAEVIVQERVNE